MVNQQQPKKGKGCFFWGCMTMVVVVVLAVIGLFVGGMLLQKWAVDRFTAEEPVKIATIEPGEAQRADARQKLDSLMTAWEQNEATTVRMTEEDINTLVATHEQLAELKGRMHVTIADGVMTADVSLPLSLLAQGEKLKDRFFNASLALSVRHADGSPKVFIDEITFKDEPPPEWLYQGLKQQELLTAWQQNQDPKAQQAWRQFNQRVRDFNIEGDALVIHTQGSGAGEISPTEQPDPATP